jgi:hypothetical protein
MSPVPVIARTHAQVSGLLDVLRSAALNCGYSITRIVSYAVDPAVSLA